MSIISTNKSQPLIYGEEIVEWDIHSANTSLMRYYNLCDEKLISYIENLPKDKRVVAIGKMMRKSKDLSVALEKAFTDIMNEFMQANHLTKDDIISFKKDALFVRSKRIRRSKFKDLEFLPKNHYTGVILIPGFEFYYSPQKLDVKGLSDEKLPLHEDGVLAFINRVMEECKNWYMLNVFLKDYSIAYKKRELQFNAYREFNADSKSRVNLFGEDVMMDDIDEEYLANTSILYNYINIYLKVLEITQR